MNKFDIEKVANHVINDFSDMSEIAISDDDHIFYVINDVSKFKSCAKYHVCTFINTDFWGKCIEYQKQDNGYMKQVITEEKKEEAKQYITQAINEIIEFSKVRNN